jgi:hypothetical protein
MKWSELDEKERSIILAEARKKVNFPEYIIEKDWWVVETMRLIKQLDICQHIVFKGGTSLSKAWGLIDRFSEDIDLAINREFFGFAGEISRTQVGKLKDASHKYIAGDFLNDLRQVFEQEGHKDVHLLIVDEKAPDDDPVKIAVEYPAAVSYSEYIQPRVLLETGSRSMMEPSTSRSFCSILGKAFPEQPFADKEISFRCVNPERTFLEKLFLLHEEHQRPIEKMNIKGKSRHFYDIYRIAQTPFAPNAIANEELYRSIVAHRERFSKLGGVDYTTHFPPNLNPIPPEELMSEWKRDFEALQSQMIANNDLTFEEIIEAVKRLCNSINSKSLQKE